MNKVFSLSVCLSIILAFSSCRSESYLENRNDLIIVHLKGTAYERGAAYGQLLQKEISETVSKWKKGLEVSLERDFSAIVEDFFSLTNFREEIESVDPELLEEVYGMSETSGIDFNTLLAFQMSEEIFTVMNQDDRRNCTTIGKARTDSTSTILAQNMDPDQFLHGHPVVLHIIPDKDEPERYIFTSAGLLGLAGMNEKGVAVTCMSISMLNHGMDGLPVVSVVRKVLTQTALEEAETFLKQTRFAIPQCFGLGGPEGVHCFECSANQVEEFYPFEDHNVVLHTNFSIRNKDFNQKFVKLLEQYGKTVDDPYFCPRYFHAYDLIKEYGMSLDIERIETILRLPLPELEPILNENTLGTLVMELDETPALFLAVGHEKGSNFHRLSFP